MRFLFTFVLVLGVAGCGKKPAGSPDFETLAGIKKPLAVAPEPAAPAVDPAVPAAPSEAPVEAAAEASAPTVEPVVAAVDSAALERGKKAYMGVCIQCHNKDPNKKGPVGPELIDAPLEVMEHKVATGVYPEVLPAGFVPKRKTKAMRKLPNSVKDVPDIYAWIQSVKN